jgi:light-regulated signal transduction histidine kinase (bacteriophytochrome)
MKLEKEIEERIMAQEQLQLFSSNLENLVKERTSRLEAANHELESFSYSVSHDLRAPLRHIKGFAAMLKNNIQTTLDEKSEHYLDVITESAEKMDTLITDLLSFSRMSHSEMMKKNVNLDLVIKSVMADFQNEIDSRNIVFKISPHPEVLGDLSMLRVVYVNLISNAIKFTSKKDNAIIEITCSEDESDFTFFVRDNGAGFDMSNSDKMFNVFQRLHSQKDYAGTGIGLALIYQIIKRHGGKTWAESKVDNGASIYFTLPKSDLRNEKLQL